MSTSKVTTVGTVSIWIEWNESLSGTTFSYQPIIYASTTKGVSDPSIPYTYNLYLNGSSITSGSGTAQYYPDSAYGYGPYVIDTWGTRTVIQGYNTQTIRLYQQFTNFFSGTSGVHYTITIDETLTVPAITQAVPDAPIVVNDDNVDSLKGQNYWVRWIYKTNDGSPQSAYEIAYGTTSSTSNTTGKVTSTDHCGMIPTASYNNGFYFKVRVWGNSDTASSWSDVYEIYVGNTIQHSNYILNNTGLSSLWTKIKGYITYLTGTVYDDYIIDSGTQNNWYYIKWASGKIDAWINKVISISSGANFYFQSLPFAMADTDYLVFTEIPSYVVNNAYSAWEVGTQYNGHDIKSTTEFTTYVNASDSDGSSDCRLWIHGTIAASNILTVTNSNGTTTDYTSGTVVITTNTSGTITTETITLG